MQSSFRNSCKFFDWYDPEFLTQANIVILGLLKKTNKQEEQPKCKWLLKLILGISLICNVILFFYLMCRWIFFNAIVISLVWCSLFNRSRVLILWISLIWCSINVCFCYFCWSIQLHVMGTMIPWNNNMKATNVT